jgi:hypothetical protein
MTKPASDSAGKLRSFDGSHPSSVDYGIRFPLWLCWIADCAEVVDQLDLRGAKKPGFENQVNLANVNLVIIRKNRRLFYYGLVEARSVSRAKVLKPPRTFAKADLCMPGGDGFVRYADIIFGAPADGILTSKAEFHPGFRTGHDAKVGIRRGFLGLIVAPEVTPEEDQQRCHEGVK